MTIHELKAVSQKLEDKKKVLILENDSLSKYIAEVEEKFLKRKWVWTIK